MSAAAYSLHEWITKWNQGPKGRLDGSLEPLLESHSAQSNVGMSVLIFCYKVSVTKSDLILICVLALECLHRLQ